MNLAPRLRATVPFLSLSLVFASDLIAIKAGLGGSPPLVLAGLRYFFGGLVMLLAAIVYPKSRSISRKHLLAAVCLGLLATIEFACLYLGMQYISAGATSVFYYTSPIFVAMLATLFLKEPLSWQKASALALGFAGVLLLFLESLSTGIVNVGGLLVLSSSFTWALGAILFKRLVKTDNFLPVTSVMLVSAGTLLLAPSLFSGATLKVSLELVLILFYLIIVCSAFGITLYYYLLRQHEATRVSIWLFLVPAFAVLLGWLLLGEQVELNEVLGIICVGASILILNR